MHQVLLLRFDAPLMSFGGVAVDERGVTMPFPGGSQLAGLLGNALGCEHRDAQALTRLQERLRYAVRNDVVGSLLEDYQTVGLDQPFLQEAWTTRHVPALRKGGRAREATHIRHRQYWADAVYVVAVDFEAASESPTAGECARAVANPERPLFLGRKPCLPAAPILLGLASARSPLEALERHPLERRLADPSPSAGASGLDIGEATSAELSNSLPGDCNGWWLDTNGVRPGQTRVSVYDQRDWINRIHTGRRFVWQGVIPVAAPKKQ